MHDWTLVCIAVDWAPGLATITFRNHESKEVQLVAYGIIDVHIPKKQEWGESVSVNETNGPMLLGNGNYFLEIEMQSGDRINIEANSIAMPAV